jgi:hypothetical protein
MIKLNGHEIIQKYTSALAVKHSWDSKYREIFEYVMPDRDGYQKDFQSGSSASAIDGQYQNRREILYSSVGENSADEFVNTMQEVFCPPYANWIDLEAGGAFPEEEREGINKELEKLSGLANEYKNNSGFDLAFSEFCYDLTVGTACMLVLPGNLRQPLVFRAIPIKDICIEDGKDGEVRAVYRAFSMKTELVKYQWPELRNMKVAAGTSEKNMELIECTYKDYDTNEFYYYVIDKANSKILLTRQYKTNPFLVLRWAKAAGEPYGRGVAMKAFNDIKSLNLVMEYSLRALAYQVPPLLVGEDAMIDVDEFQLTPFSLNVVPDTQNSIVPLNLNTSYDIQGYKIEELTMNIKQAMFGNTIPTQGQTRTATEIQQRIDQLKKNFNSVFGRLIGEFQIPLIRRIFDILIGFQYIKEDFDVSKIDGFIYKVKVNTPLAKQLKFGEAQNMLMASNMLLQADPSGQALQTSLKVNEMSAYLLDILGVPARFINTPEQSSAMQQQQAEGAAQAQAAALEADVQASNAKELGKEMAKQNADTAII